MKDRAVRPGGYGLIQDGGFPIACGAKAAELFERFVESPACSRLIALELGETIEIRGLMHTAAEHAQRLPAGVG